jgi:bacterial/archaeal transporter family protein
MLLVGVLGVTTKLALRTVGWPALLLWTAAVYAVVAVVLLASGARLRLGPGTAYALLSGSIAAGGLVLFFLALQRGDATRVVPVTSAYPVVTALLGAAVLSERLTAATAVGTALVLGGIVLITSAR